MHFVRRFKSLPLASACFLSALLTLPALAEWQVNSATSPTILSNAETGWTLTVKMETGGLILQSTTAGEGRLDLTDVEADTGWKVTSVQRATLAITSLVAPDATHIYGSAFQGQTNLTSVVVSDAIDTIGRMAFSGCSKLRTFSPTTLSALTSLGESAFSSCTNLVGDFSFPVLSALPKYAFNGTRISSVSLPSAESVGSYAFHGCTLLANLECSISLTTVSGYAFVNCPLSPRLELPGAMTIGDMAFYGTGVEEVLLPSVISIGANAFDSSPNLERVVASESLESVGKLAFYNCSQLQSFNPWCLPRLETLGSQAFCGCTELAGDFSFPRLAAIPYMGFQGTKVSSVRAPAATTIGDRAFVSASLLTNLVMRGSSTAVPRYTFSGISAGARIWWLGKEAPVSFGAITLAAGTGTDRARVYVKNGHDRENWESRCTRTAPTAADMALADYPGAKRLIGVMGNTAWVLRTGDDGTMIRLL